MLFRSEQKAAKKETKVHINHQGLTGEEYEKADKISNKPKRERVEKELKSYTWRELETNGKFAKNDKLSFITDDMLIVGCDIGSETHYIRAIDIRGRELSRKAFEFSNTAEGFEAAKVWMLELAVQNRKSQIVRGLEPTGHYWFTLAAWLITAGISVVQVNPYAVRSESVV